MGDTYTCRLTCRGDPRTLRPRSPSASPRVPQHHHYIKRRGNLHFPLLRSSSVHAPPDARSSRRGRTPLSLSGTAPSRGPSAPPWPSYTRLAPAVSVRSRPTRSSSCTSSGALPDRAGEVHLRCVRPSSQYHLLQSA